MASSPRNEREAERRHNIRTLGVASAASAAAATVTSQLWIAGTWIAAALTPVLVTLVSELLNRPAERIARAWTTERPALPDDGEPPSAAPPPRSMPAPGPGDAPVRVYRQRPARPPRRKLAIGAVLATAGLAFVIAVVTITAGELIAGESIGKGEGRTTLAGGKSQKQDEEDKQPVDERQTDTTEEQPTQTETESETPREQSTVTEPAPPTTTTETSPAPQAETAPPPLTETAPAP
jgi:hypothetical protein